MANRRLSMRKIEKVLRLHEGGRTNREIAQAVRASPTTVGEYLRRARLAGLAWPLPQGMTELAVEAALFPTAERGVRSFLFPPLSVITLSKRKDQRLHRLHPST